MIRLVIADDHPVVRLGLRALFELETDIEVVAEADSPAHVVQVVRELRPDVVLMDLQFGEEHTGADATRVIMAEPGAPRVLVLTNYDTDGDILRAVEAGASGYLLKDAPPDDLLAAVRAAASGEVALAPRIAERLRERQDVTVHRLTRREIEVLERVAVGDSNQHIARDLGISEPTVKSHLAHVFGKLEVSSRTAAVAEGRRRGVLR